MSYEAVQSYMREQKIDAWTVFDFRNNNPVTARLFGGVHHLTRRVLWSLPAHGEPKVLSSFIDATVFNKLGIKHEVYTTWGELHSKIAAMHAGARRVAMEYSPGGALPTAGIVDAGTIEFMRSLGLEVVSSADLVQIHAAAWGEKGLASHRRAIAHCDRIMQDAFAFATHKLKSGGALTELDIKRSILDAFAKAGLSTDSGPIVSVNEHASDPHYEPDEKLHSPVRAGDWLLIDLWAKEPGDDTVYGDITWTGVVGREPSARERDVFAAVIGARDACIEAAKGGWKAGEVVEGWQLDDAARAVLLKSGNGQFIGHRTGHSLSPGTTGAHGIGMNLDNMETHDVRRMVPGTGFTIEPGLYVGAFGVRSEVNVYVDPAHGPVVTGQIQREILRIG